MNNSVGATIEKVVRKIEKTKSPVITYGVKVSSAKPTTTITIKNLNE